MSSSSSSQHLDFLEDTESLKRRLALVDAEPAEDGERPRWVRALTLAISLLRSGECSSCDDATVPFSDFYEAFVAAATVQLHERTADFRGLATDWSMPLQELLRKRLSYVGSQALYLEFCVARQLRAGTYVGFVDWLRREGVISILSEYPVMARLLGDVMAMWVDAATDVAARIASDRADLQRLFGRGADIGDVVRVQPLDSDPHRGGRYVCVVSFTSGLRVVYKPRTVDLESWFSRFLAWCAREGARIELKAPLVLARPGYGWTEYVEHQECESDVDVREFYRRFGALMASIYVTGGTDFHHENVVAHGRYPVFVDLEMLLTPSLEPVAVDANDADTNAGLSVAASVLASSLLPVWEPVRGQPHAIDVSALGAFGDSFVVRRQRWERLNTDDLTIASFEEPLVRSGHLPRQGGMHRLPPDYIDEIVSGFRETYSFVQRARHRLVASEVFAELRDAEIRVVFRPTGWYYTLLQNSVVPHALRNVDGYVAQLMPIQRPSGPTDGDDAFAAVKDSEVRSLAQLDVPYFTARADRDQLNGMGDPLFARSGMDVFAARLQELNDDDRRRQEALIETSLVGRTLRPHHASTAAHAFDDRHDSSWNRDRYVFEAERIGQELVSRAVRGVDRSVTWIGLSFDLTTQKYYLTPLSADLYDGIGGVAVFLAALATAAGRPRYADVALQSLDPLVRSVQSGLWFEHHKSEARLGAGTGIGSLVWSLASLSMWTGSRDTLDAAAMLAEAITDDIISRDRALDVISGSAGAILGLVKLYEQTGQSDLLRTATACADHLLRERVVYEGLHVWRTLAQTPLTGFSHGVAGIAYALLRLAGATHDDRCVQAASQAFAYERRMYAAEENNWPDFRSDPPGFMVAWCHGAVGVGFARLAPMAAQDRDANEDLRRAVLKTLTAASTGLANLCCGDLGRADLLLEAGVKLENPAMIRRAGSLLQSLVDRRNLQGHFAVLPTLPTDEFAPGLFQGIAGMGYQLLRQASPEALPSVLLWR